MAQGSHEIFTDNGTTDIITASDIEILVGSDDSKDKGGGTVNLNFRQHPDAEWSIVATFSEVDTIEDFKANSRFGGQYQIELVGSTSPDLQVSWRM